MVGRHLRSIAAPGGGSSGGRRATSDRFETHDRWLQSAGAALQDCIRRRALVRRIAQSRAAREVTSGQFRVRSTYDPGAGGRRKSLRILTLLYSRAGRQGGAQRLIDAFNNLYNYFNHLDRNEEMNSGG